MNKEQRATEDKMLLNLMLEHPHKFKATDFTMRVWTIEDFSSHYSALRLGRIIDEDNAKDRINAGGGSWRSLACLIYEGVNNFEEEIVFDHGECNYTAVLKDLRQNLFVLKRENTANENIEQKDRIIIIPESANCD
jgi:hypothetical protein